MGSFLLRPFLLVVVLFAGSLTEPVHAALSLSVNPLDGGTGIRFERVLPGMRNMKQVQLRITSTEGRRYQVFQRVYEPIVNERGQALDLAAIESAALPNSNASGTLYMQNGERLGYGEQLIYSSGQTGESDAFAIAYAAIPGAIGSSGHYRGRVVYTVRAQGAADQDEVIVDFSLESAVEFKIAVQGGRDPKRIRIKDTDDQEQGADFVKVSFSENGSEDIKIYQEYVSPLTNEQGTELAPEAIKTSLQGNGQYLRSAELSRSRVLIYNGRTPQDEFLVYFLTDPVLIQDADAGFYKGQLRYIVETSSDRREFLVDVECEIKPVFTVQVTLPPEGLSFGHILPSSPAQEKQVLVTVRSNLRKPYQVVQHMTSVMINQAGKEFDKKYFTFSVNLDAQQKGRTNYREPASVEVGEYPIYYSDAQGSSVTFTVNYQLKGYFDMSSGNFVAPLKFSLNQN